MSDNENYGFSVGEKLLEISRKLEGLGEKIKGREEDIKDIKLLIRENYNDIQNDLRIMRENILESTKTMKDDGEKNYTKKSEFEPIRLIVYGFVSFILLGVGGMFFAIIDKTGGSLHGH